MHTFTEFLSMMVIEKAHITKTGEYVQWHPVPYSHAEAVHEIHKAIAASNGSRDAAATPFLDSKLLSHTESNNVHSLTCSIAQERAAYFQLLSLDVMHISCCSGCSSRSSLLC